MSLDPRRGKIIDLIHEIVQPPSPGTDRPGITKRYRSIFTAGEMAVMYCLLERGVTPIDDVPSVVAIQMLTDSKLVVQPTRSGSVQLTPNGRSVANFLIPHL